MSRLEVRVIVLFEDEAQRCFLRELVKRYRLNPERWVRGGDCTGVLARLPAEVQELRSRNYQKNCGLLVAIDADARPGFAGRRTQLLRLISEHERGERAPGERIALLIPALEIENWYVHLCLLQARPIDETRDYKETSEWRELNRDLGAAARKAIAAWPPDAGRDDPPSLVAARDELRRVS